ncbi:hypothetical protein [Acidovorax sp. Leaf78]|uniref:head-tail joining protein n=1 Tax=Acidovorax sp. Leaf78 TaxID=1736237 RepID=UPI0007160E7A|nr:hypothetical protein [Acidovorax sp. Leaf78]KQO23491.1 hypothetical protein ASF16_04835 [Acidovorax sp. Leaf78]
MTLAPFADRAARLNRAVEAHLSNATATFEGGQPFGVQLEKGQTDGFGGAGGVVDGPEITVSLNVAAHAPGLAEGGQLVIDGVVYTVGVGVQPDSSGWASGLVIFRRS